MATNRRFILGLAAAAIVLSGCSADDGARRGEPSAPPLAITFSAATADGNGSATRTASNTLTLEGSGTNEQSLRAQGFGVFASHTGYHPYVSSTTTCNLMWNQQVTDTNADGTWTYNPVAYWPDTEDELDEYVTFFAYAPYSNGSTDANAACIVDFSLPGETGDPWLTYQLGGTMYADGADGWKASQVDLLYDFQKDQQRPYPPSASKVTFRFKHALACVGDRITVTCSNALQTYLKGLYSSSDVTMTLNTLRLSYTLTKKGRLVLNGNGTPNWQTVNSSEAMVTRQLVVNPDQVIATATSASACTLTDYVATNQGIFYIPIELAGHQQTVKATVDYTLSTGDSGQISTTILLSNIFEAGEGRNLNLVLSI